MAKKEIKVTQVTTDYVWFEENWHISLFDYARSIIYPKQFGIDKNEKTKLMTTFDIPENLTPKKKG